MIPERLELIPYSLTFGEPYVTSRGELRDRQLLLIRITDADGAVGLGETVSLSLRGGPSISQIERDISERCWPALEGQEIEADRIWAAVAACRGRGAGLQAACAIDIALHDLAGKIAGKPVWALLGAEAYEPVRCNATLPAANPTELARIAEGWVGLGFRTLKLKVGVPNDVQQVKLVRETIGPEPRIRVDANGAWSVDEACSRLRKMALDRLEIVEQPSLGLEDLAEVRAQTQLTIAADESLVDSRDAKRAFEMRACDLGTVKLAKSGGILAALEIGNELLIYLSSALDGPVGIAAAAHTAQALRERGNPSMTHGLATELLFKESIASVGPTLDRDMLSVGEGPGLGVELDEDALAQLRD